MAQTGKSSRRRGARALVRELVEAMVEAETSPSEIASRLEVELDRLSALAAEESTLRTLRGLARLADVRAQMLLSKYRANAAAHLIAIASAEEPSELARKACVDLLHANLDVFDSALEGDDSKPSQSAPDEKTILAALEELGGRQT